MLEGAKKLRRDLSDATDAYEHFLFGKGKTQIINYNGYIESDESGKILMQSACRRIINEARKRHNKFLKSHHTGNIPQITFEIRTEPISVGHSKDYPYPQTENWQKAIGAHEIFLEAKVQIDTKQSTKIRIFNVQMTLHMEDMYNFNPGNQDIATGIKDSENGRFEITGLAHEYLNIATIDRTFSASEPINTTAASDTLINVDNPQR